MVGTTPGDSDIPAAVKQFQSALQRRGAHIAAERHSRRFAGVDRPVAVLVVREREGSRRRHDLGPVAAQDEPDLS